MLLNIRFKAESITFAMKDSFDSCDYNFLKRSRTNKAMGVRSYINILYNIMFTKTTKRKQRLETVHELSINCAKRILSCLGKLSWTSHQRGNAWRVWHIGVAPSRFHIAHTNNENVFGFLIRDLYDHPR